MKGQILRRFDFKILDEFNRAIKTGGFEADSLVKHFIHAIRSGYSAVQYSDTDSSNTSRTQGTTEYETLNAAVNVSTYGMLVGTGTGAVAITDYKLGTQINEGTGAGQLTHSACAVNAVVVSAPTASFTVTRNFFNGSGNSITLEEVGLYSRGYVNTTRYFLVCRDLLGSVVLLNGKTFVGTYLFSVST